MAIIEIRDVLDNETGKTIFPRTHVDAVIGLEDSSYFEKVQDADDPTKFSIKLKSEYTGLRAEGWIAAGGIGSGGGGGGGGLISEVLGLSSLGSVQAEDLTKTFSAYAIDSIYKQVQDLEDRIDGSGLIGGYLKTSDGGFFLTSEGQKILLKGSGGIGASSLSDLTDTSIYNPLEGDLLVWSGASWVNVRQSTIKPDLSGYATTEQLNELNERIRSLAESILWELDSDNNVTLKSGHSNAWVPGWLAAGGIGTESSGGVSFLKELTDIYHNENGILRSDGTAVQNGDVLVYDSTNARWSAAAQSGGGGSTVSWGEESGYKAPLTVDGVSKTVLLNGALSGYATTSQLSGYLPLTGGTLTGDLRLKNTGNYGLAINFGDGNFVYLKEATDDVLSIYAKNGISLSASETSSKFEWDSANNAWHFHGNVYADGWMAAGGIGSGSSGGSVVSISNLLSSGTRVATLTIDGEDYDILAPSGGSGGSTVSWGTQSGNTIPLSVDGTSKTLLLSDALSGYATQSWVQSQGYLTSHQSLSGYATETWVENNYLPLAGGQLTGDLRLKPASSNYGSMLRFGDGNYAYIQENTDDHLNFYASKGMNFETGSGYDITLNGVSVSDIVTLSTAQTITGAKTFSTNPVTIASDSGISVNASSYIDIGDARLEYDSGAKALHVTYRSGSGQTIGLFADGFLAAGGVAGQSNVKFVTLDGDQIIEGEKTFTGYTEFSSSLQITGDDITSGSLLYVNGLTTIAGDLSLTGTLNGISVSKDSYGYGDISIGSRLYIQTNSNDLLLGSGSGKVIVGSHPGGTAIGSNKFYVGGTAIATSWNTTSDRRLKDEISLLQKDEAIEKLMALAPSTWKWNSGSEKGKMASGFIAQEMEDVLPFMVFGEDYKGVAYQMLHAYEVSAIQSHEERIRVLEKENAMLRDMINTIRA